MPSTDVSLSLQSLLTNVTSTLVFVSSASIVHVTSAAAWVR